MGITPIMEHAAQHFGKSWKPNTRETVRRQTVHQFVQAGLITPNPDAPTRPTNSPHSCYQIAPRALALVQGYGTRTWDAALAEYRAVAGSLAEMYAQRRDAARIPLALPGDTTVSLTPGGQSPLVHALLTEFCPRFTPAGYPICVGDTGKKHLWFDEAYLASLGVVIEHHGKMPDVIVHHIGRNWLVLTEAVTSHGPIDPKRRHELATLFAASLAGLVFVTAFRTRDAFRRYLRRIAWETEVWTADVPDHMVHFNGERFLGPYDTPSRENSP